MNTAMNALYGSLDSPSQSLAKLPSASEDLEDPQDYMEWEDRGSVLGLVVDVAGSHATNAIAIATMIIGCHVHERHNACLIGDQKGLQSIFISYFCEYTEAFLDCFPYFVWSVFVMGAAKDFMQKRLYYGMLKRGGVLNFQFIKAYFDPLWLVLVICYVHVLAHIGVLLHLSMMRMQNLETTEKEAGNKEAWAQFRKSNQNVVVLASTVAIPATIFVVFSFVHYDINKALVTLSEYVHDVAACNKTDSQETLRTLHVVTDAVARDFVERELVTKEGNLLHFTDACEELAHECEKLEKVPSDDDPAPYIPLLQSLWPGQFLLKTSIQGYHATSFRRFWEIFAVFIMASMAFTLMHLVYLGIEDITDVCSSTCVRHPQALLRLGVTIMHVILVGEMIRRVAITLSWRK